MRYLKYDILISKLELNQIFRQSLITAYIQSNDFIEPDLVDDVMIRGELRPVELYLGGRVIEWLKRRKRCSKDLLKRFELVYHKRRLKEYKDLEGRKASNRKAWKVDKYHYRPYKERQSEVLENAGDRGE